MASLISSRQLDTFLGAYKHFSEMFAFEYGDILLLGVLCEGKNTKAEYELVALFHQGSPTLFEVMSEPE